MRKKISKIAQTMVAALMLMCVITGVILMMCESDDWQMQKQTLFGGMALFLIGAIPAFLIAWLGRLEDGNV